MTAAVRFHLLRPLSIERDGRALVLGGKPRLLLAVLLLRSGTPVPHDRLAEIIWGNDLPRNVRGSIHTVVSRLRAALGDSGDLIQATSSGYLVEVGPDQLDLLRFRQLLAAAETAPDQRRELPLLRDALDLWREGALTGFDSDELTREDLAELHELRLTVLERRVELDLSLGGQFDLVPELRRLVAQHPLRERLWSYLIQALAQSGRQSDALAAFHDVRRLLDDQLGIRPGQELRDAHQAVLLGHPVRRDTRPGDWQLSNQLPLPPSHFSGRAKEAEQVQAALAGSDTEIPVAVISGVPGVGKSALAVRVAYDAAHRFPDGQWFVQLAGASQSPSTPAAALADLLVASGVRSQDVPAGLEARSGLFRARLAGRRVLVLLDDAADAEQVRPLLPGTTNCAIIVTSRQRLSSLTALIGAQPLSLTQLPDDDSQALLSTLPGRDRLARSQVAELAELCGHLPLALRIAAAQIMDGTDVDHYLTELREGLRLDGLTLHDDTSAAVRSTFGTALRALDPQLARLFALLGHVTGPDLTAAAAGALLDVPESTASQLLQQLTEASLLEEHHTGRYRLHDLLRSYAEELAPQYDGSSAARHRLLDNYLDGLGRAAAAFATSNAGLLRPLPASAPPADDVALAWLDSERPNLVAATLDAARRGPHETAWLLAERLILYFGGRGLADDWRSTAEAGLRAAEAAGHDLARGAMLRSLSRLFANTGDLVASRTTIAKALEAYRLAGDLPGEARSLNQLGVLEANLTSATAALALFRQVAELWDRIGDRKAGATARLNIASMLRQSGRLTEALPAALEARRRLEEFGDLRDSYALHLLAHIHQDRGELDTALALQQEEVAGVRASGRSQDLAESLERLAAIYRDRGEYPAARRTARESVDLTIEVHDELVECHARATLGDALLGLGQLPAALKEYDAALAIAERVESAEIQVRSMLGLAAARLAAGDDTALATAEEAARRAADLDMRVLRGRVLAVLAKARLAAGALTEAEAAARAAVELHEEAGALVHLTAAQKVLSDIVVTN
ncbi:AfsR/SARP family transcriptional regulator [Kribbella italica]|uniref:DNA-binding SARP family transcriptional activator n=1 Tax=Kribbella italica TaxID=1540520 RepID=A0A7W9J3K4_9ACTN|nr:BTAD domain-containing putative transcriptional regulator [Kribbella italica]MBB5835012.1 DNA-binding SARP family transcriptional activator [Kribbella italica]